MLSLKSVSLGGKGPMFGSRGVSRRHIHLPCGGGSDLNWPRPTNMSKVKSFLGMLVAAGDF